MEKKRIEKFKKQLLERRQELLKSIAQTQEEGRAMQHSYGPDEGDRANSSLDKELLFTQTTHARGNSRSLQLSRGSSIARAQHTKPRMNTL